MKKIKLTKIFMSMALVIATVSAGTASYFYIHEPKKPKCIEDILNKTK